MESVGIRRGTRRMRRKTSSSSLFSRDLARVSRKPWRPIFQMFSRILHSPPTPPSPVLARRLVVLHRHPLRCRPASLPFPLFFALACCRSAHKAPSEAERGKSLCVGGAMAGSSKKRGSKKESGEVDVYVGKGGACVAIINRRAGWMWKGPHVWEPGQGRGGDALRETHERRQYVWGDI